MVFQKRLTYLLVWVTWDSLLRKRMLLHSHTHQPIKCKHAFFKYPWVKLWSDTCLQKSPRGGEGFTFWPMDYYECSPSFLFPFPRSLMPLLTIQSNLWMKKCWGMFYLKVFPTSTSSLWLFSEPLGYYLLHLKIRRYNDHCNCSNNCPRQTKKDKLISYMKQCKHIW